MTKLTDRQSQILTFVARHCRSRGYAPSTREIGREFGIAATAVLGHLKALETRGGIGRAPKVARGIQIL